MIDLPAGLGKNEAIAFLRKAGIAARDALPQEKRMAASDIVYEKIAKSQIFVKAKTVMVYAAVRSELSLESLLTHLISADKRFVYPLCESSTLMSAYCPKAWKKGAFGINEPDPMCSEKINPDEIDLVICPGAEKETGSAWEEDIMTAFLCSVSGRLCSGPRLKRK